MNRNILKINYFLLLVLLAMFPGYSAHAQFLRASGKLIVDESGKELILRGMGLGGWMLQEPYMMEMSDFAGTQWQIKAKIQSLAGEQGMQAFYDAWHANHCTRRDIDSLASWGFNSVRLPMHYNLFTLPVEKEPDIYGNTWLSKGFTMVDSLVAWCKANRMYVILDLHAAPGGQGKDAAICDYDASKPSLWENEANKSKTIALWRKLAERYANEPWIAGYDLLNEPNWSFTAGGNQNGCSETSNAPLRKLYIDITNAIRQVDTKHLIIIEGNCWGNNYNGIMPLWDNNMALSFHKYWSVNDQNSISGILNLRNQYSVPIWLGESGENSNVWFTDAIRLAESNGIGWAWWPLKKINSIVNPMTIVKTADYQSLLSYWKNGGTAPSATFTTNTLIQMAINANPANCIYRKDVIDAMFRQVHDTTTIPYVRYSVPGKIAAADFDLGRMGKAYSDTDFADYHVTEGGSFVAWNKGYFYRNDAVDIGLSVMTDSSSNGFYVGWTADNEWLQYTVDVDSAAAYAVTVTYAAAADGSKIRLLANGGDLSGSLALPATGGNQSWAKLTIPDIVLSKGRQPLRIWFEKGGCNLSSVGFALSKNSTDVALKAVSAETGRLSEVIYLNCSKPLADSAVSAAGFSCTVNGSAAIITSVAVNPNNHNQLIFRLARSISDIDEIMISYQGGQVKATDGTPLTAFSNLAVTNNLPVYPQVPGKIEAEAFTFNYGLQTENTTDTGGGQNIGYTNAGDYADYSIRVMKTADYTLDVRVACKSAAGIIEVQQLSSLGAVLHSVRLNVGVTGGWQTWKTISATMRLDAGICTLRVKIIQPEFNINWYRFSEIANGIDENESAAIGVFPNPAQDAVSVRFPEHFSNRKKLLLHSPGGVLLRTLNLAPGQHSADIQLRGLPKGFYVIEIESAGRRYHKKLLVY